MLKVCVFVGWAAGGLSACHHSEASGHRDILRRGLSGEPATLDPGALTDTFSHEVVRDLYEGLTAQTATGEVISGVAESWTVDPAGIEYTFNLRSTARWSDGKEVTAQDFVNGWRRVVDPTSASPGADLLRIIAGASSIMEGHAAPASLGVTAVDPHRLVVRLERPAPYFPALLAHAVTYPLYSAERASSHDPTHWVSNGPYVLAEWLPGTRVRLVRNPKYWDATHVAIAQVEYHVAPDDTVQLRRYSAGELDITDSIPAAALPTLKRDHPNDIHVEPFLGTVYYALNLSRPPFADNLELRQALAMAVDRQRVVRGLGFGQPMAFGFVPPRSWNYTPQAWDWRDLSDAAREAKAQQLYAQAGYGPAKPLHLRLLYNTSLGIKNTALIVASQWKSVLGVDCELDDCRLSYLMRLTTPFACAAIPTLLAPDASFIGILRCSIDRGGFRGVSLRRRQNVPL